MSTSFVRWCLLRLSELLQTLSCRRRKKLYVAIDLDGEVKIGTCKHCVAYEQRRPARSWAPRGDHELDFPRDALIEQLTAHGVHLSIDQEYICP